MVKSVFFLLILAGTALAQESPHGAIRFECNTCHGTDSWEMKSDALFNHESVGFALTGQHKTLKCQSCHEGLHFAPRKSDCLSCHTDVHKSELGTNCLRCHTTQSWLVTDMVQKHQQTRFPLLGRHSTVPCQTCHANAAQHQYTGISSTCIGCHRNDFQATTSPNHMSAGFSTECAQCHSVTASAWGAGFDHNLTRFPLTGAHLAQPCASCHTGNVFQSMSVECASCHQQAYATALNPNHVTAGFPTQCQTCHTTVAWQPAHFDHNGTRFQLTGAHVAQQCQACHTNNNYQLVFTGCVQCHLADYQKAVNPNHVSGNFSQACHTCHSSAAWRPATFDHNATRFPLTGEHARLQCQECHRNGNYQLVYTGCSMCHDGEFQKAINPNHVTNGISRDCQTCHTTTAWSPATFDHGTTKFALTGAHTAQACLVCHTNNNYQLAYTGCVQCHQADFQKAVNPNHVSGNFSQTCQTCHNTIAWQPATFDHNTTKFALTGAHTAQACQTCHTNGNYQLAYTGCVQCHLSNFQATTNPSHVAGNFSQTCQTCHNTTAWQPATFDHSTTKFALTGAHTAQACLVCHTNNNYQLAYTGCVQCHQADFQKAVNPNHVAGNFSQTCQTCHNTTAWQPATFDHNTTKFALTGAHTAQACQTCHTNNNYQLAYTGCVQCHLSNYQQTTNPNHAAAGFPTTCQTCHTTTVWTGATFNHTWFPTNHGNAQGVCSTCHANSSDYSVFQCTNCHTKSQTDSHHTSVSGYVWNSVNCYQCHPRGSGG